ncbi:hypothetical protein K1719_002012 [Acacia pycnantha]|nr:hypothetical protein K1719_002012 [Acacia pycnantha]
MQHRDSVAWNAMTSGYSQWGLYHEAYSHFGGMRVSHGRNDNFSLSSTLSACAGTCHLQPGTRAHALMVVSVDVLYNGNQIIEINAFGDPNCAVDITRQRWC